MRKIWQDISKGLATSATFVTFYSLYLQKTDKARVQQLEAFLTEAKNQQSQCLSRTDRIQTLYEKLSEIHLQNQGFKIKFFNLQDNFNQILKLQNEINNIETNLTNSTDTCYIDTLLNLQQEKIIALKNLYIKNNVDLNYYGKFINNLLYGREAIASDSAQSLTTANESNSANQSFNTLDNSASSTNEELPQQTLDLITTVPQDSNSFGPSMDIFNSYREFLSTLSLDQLACLANAIGLFTIFFILTSIFLTLFGSYLIDSFNLEIKFPKLAKIIQLRQNVTKFYITVNILFLYVFILALIFVNLFLLFT